MWVPPPLPWPINAIFCLFVLPGLGPNDSLKTLILTGNSKDNKMKISIKFPCEST